MIIKLFLANRIKSRDNAFITENFYDWKFYLPVGKLCDKVSSAFTAPCYWQFSCYTCNTDKFGPNRIHQIICKTNIKQPHALKWPYQESRVLWKHFCANKQSAFISSWREMWSKRGNFQMWLSSSSLLQAISCHIKVNTEAQLFHTSCVV